MLDYFFKQLNLDNPRPWLGFVWWVGLGLGAALVFLVLFP